MTVLTLAGKAINWSKPPKPTDRVKWSGRTTSGREITGSFRTIAHLDHLNALAIKKFGRGLRVFQGPYNTGVKASAGTHDFDACLDVWIDGVTGSDQQRFFRTNGAGAYLRTPAQGFTLHIHYFTLPPREGSDVNDDYRSAGFKVGHYVDGGWSTAGRKYTSSQIGDYYSHRNALSGHAHDPSWFPPNIAATIFDLDAYVRAQKPPAKKPPVKVSATDMVVATNNVMSLPENPQIAATLAATPTAGVVCVQEVDLPKFKKAIYAVPKYRPIPTPNSDVYNATILFKPSLWAVEFSKFVPQYDGVKGVSKTRHIAVAGLRSKVTGETTVFISVHDVTKGTDSVRRRLRAQTRKQVRRQVNYYRKRGLSVVVGGDFNQVKKVFATAQFFVNDGYDHLYFWSASKARLRFKKVLAKRVVPTRSDHNALVARVSTNGKVKR